MRQFRPPSQGWGAHFQDAPLPPCGGGRWEVMVYACRCIHMLHKNILIQMHVGICIHLHSCTHMSFYKL